MAKAKRSTTPPSALLDRFRKAESIDQIAVLVTAEGFDPETIRALGAWARSRNSWVEPKRQCPDWSGGPDAWSWLVDGWTVDIEAIAETANLSVAVARSRINVLIGARLIYPDGTMVSFALSAINMQLKKALGIDDEPKPRKPKAKPARAAEEDGEGEAN